MKQALYNIFLISLLLCAVDLAAQSYVGNKQEDEPLRNELSVGLNLNTNSGLLGGLVFRYGYLYPSNKRLYTSLEIVNVKHPIEVQNRSSTGSFFIPGKSNYILAIRPQIGTEIDLFKKEAENGVALSAIFAGGPTIGLVKPYYVKVQSQDSLGTFTVELNSSSLDPNEILGHANFFSGFGKSSIEWGINAKAALNFEFGKYNSLLTGLEAGWNVEIFKNELQILSYSDIQTRVFSSLYLTLYFGTRY